MYNEVTKKGKRWWKWRRLQSRKESTESLTRVWLLRTSSSSRNVRLRAFARRIRTLFVSRPKLRSQTLSSRLWSRTFSVRVWPPPRSAKHSESLYSVLPQFSSRWSMLVRSSRKRLARSHCSRWLSKPEGAKAPSPLCLYVNMENAVQRRAGCGFDSHQADYAWMLCPPPLHEKPASMEKTCKQVFRLARRHWSSRRVFPRYHNSAILSSKKCKIF